jgi:hypothetical protein
MSILEFQRALADMTLDAGLAAAARARGAGAFDGYALTGRELRRLEAVAGQPGMSVGCTLARANRFGPIHDAFPMTCVLLGNRLKPLLDEVWSARRPDNYQLAGEEEAFAAHVQSGLAAGALPVEYLHEVFDYEKACWELAMKVRSLRSGSAGDLTLSVRFRHDPAKLLDPLERYEVPPPGLECREYMVRIRVVDDELRADWDDPSG